MEDKLLKFEILMQGIGILMSWNVVLASFDWFNSEFPGDNPSFIFPILNNGSSIIVQPLIVWYGYRLSYTKRTVISYAIVGAMLILSPIMVAALGDNGGFPVMCVIITIMGTSSVVAQTTIFGLAGTLPDEYTNYVMIGNGMAGVFVDVLRLICLGVFPQNSTGYLISTTVYFIIAGGVIFGCVVAMLHLMKHPLVISALGKTGAKVGGTKTEEELLRIAGEESSEGKKNMVIDNKELLGKIWQPLFLVWLGYVITFGMLSGVALSTEVPELSYPYFATLMVLTFNIADFLGRSTPRFYILSIPALWIVTFSRFATWVTFILIASDDPSIPPGWLFSGTWFKFINMFIFAYTNGFASTCAMILGPAQVQDYMKAKAGSLMSMGLLYGIVSGSVVALAFTNVGHIPS